MERYGVIDIGTNSMRLLVAGVEGKTIVNRYKAMEFTRIGQGTDGNGIISREAIERNVTALNSFLSTLRQRRAVLISAIATSAVRDATNRQQFIDLAKEKTGVDIEVISGNQEAELGFKGVMGGLSSASGNTVVIDIGGGSTEIIFAKDGEISFKTSLNIGGVRMTERFVDGSFIKNQQKNDMLMNIIGSLEDTITMLKKFNIDRIIGIGGTATTMAAIKLNMDSYDGDKIHGTSVSRQEIQDITDQLFQMDLESRKTIVGLQPQRADIMPAASLILNTFMQALEGEKMVVSDYDNLEGKLFDLLF